MAVVSNYPSTDSLCTSHLCTPIDLILKNVIGNVLYVTP